MRTLYTLENPVQRYAWGSTRWIPQLLGLNPKDDLPWAELWMGAHPKAPSRISGKTGTSSLAAAIEEDPQGMLGSMVARKGSDLPFLFKLLAAAQPLSIQAHPSIAQAKEGWERENALSIPLDSPERNYKDQNHKPEILCALTPFRAMCGFRTKPEILALLEVLEAPGILSLQNLLAGRDEAQGLELFLRGLFGMGQGERAALTEHIRSRVPRLRRDLPSYDAEWTLLDQFAEAYPGDPGIIAPLYLNVLDLDPGQAVFLPSGVLHAYVSGFGIELMANSDNVLRGGLTPKHVDVEELIRVLGFQAFRPNILSPAFPPDESRSTDAPTPKGLCSYPPCCEEFALALYRNSEPAFLEQGLPYIIITTEGSVEIRSGKDEICRLDKGQSVFVSASASSVSLHGVGTAYIAGVGRA